MDIKCHKERIIHTSSLHLRALSYKVEFGAVAWEGKMLTRVSSTFKEDEGGRPRRGWP